MSAVDDLMESIKSAIQDKIEKSGFEIREERW